MIDNSVVNTEVTSVKAYVKPVIVHELQLETRAGSPLRINPIVDPLGIDPSKG